MNDGTALDMSETEEGLIAKAQNAISSCNWTVGECAAIWTQKYARGRTDSEFAKKVGLSVDQVYQRRRVWESFADVYQNYPALKWSHFYVTLNCDDAAECLQWADENQANVAEMRAWRRLQRGEDLTTHSELDQLADESLVSFVPEDPTLVRDPATLNGKDVDQPNRDAAKPSQRAGDQTTVTTAARELNGRGSEYAPFRKGAGSPAPTEESVNVAVAERPKPSAAQVVKRMTTALERCNSVLTSEFKQEFRRLPKKLQNPFIKAVGELSSKVAELM